MRCLLARFSFFLNVYFLYSISDCDIARSGGRSHRCGATRLLSSTGIRPSRSCLNADNSSATKSWRRQQTHALPLFLSLLPFIYLHVHRCLLPSPAACNSRRGGAIERDPGANSRSRCFARRTNLLWHRSPFDFHFPKYSLLWKCCCTMVDRNNLRITQEASLLLLIFILSRETQVHITIAL